MNLKSLYRGNLCLKDDKRRLNRFSVKLTRLTALLLIVFCLQAKAADLSPRLTLSERHVSIKKIVKEVGNQTGYLFLYKNKLIDARPSTINVSNASLNTVFQIYFAGQPLTYESDDEKVTKQTQASITGTVTDSRGLILQGVSVKLEGSATAFAGTDAKGNFSFTKLPPGNYTLTYTYLGFAKSTRQVTLKDGEEKVQNISLQLESGSLNEVIVVGYGTQSRRNISGAITLVTEENFNKGVNRNAFDLIQGKVAGLAITTEGGDVTSQQTIRLRGTSSLTGSSAPFVVIDGIPGMDLNSVAPQDIESISVLKDASAVAIYGSRSASGVILITTKKGKAGQTSAQYDSYMAFDATANKPQVLNAAEWTNYAREKSLDVKGLDFGANTDWFDEITRNGFSQNHSLSVSGGLEKGSYRASLNYLDREGIMRDNMLERYNALFTVNQSILNDRVHFGFTTGSVKSSHTPTNSYNTVLAFNMLPVYPVKNDDGSWFEITDFNQGNPAHNIAENKNLYKNTLVYSGLKTDVNITQGLKASVNLFKQRKTENISRYNGSTTQAGRNDQGYAYRGNKSWDKSLLELTGEYSKELGNHSLKVLGGYSFEENTLQAESASNRGFITDIFEDNNLSAGENLFPTDVYSFKNMSRLISFFGRLNYSFNGKYIITGTLREDGSSKFGANNKWGIFPSLSGAWRISDEPFLSESSIINDLKLRVGYGIVGNQEGVDPYNSVALYGRSDEFFDNGVWRNTYKYKQNDNPNLRWEQTASSNIGLDYSLVNNRISGTLDYYIKNTSDLLYVYNVPVPPNLYPTMLANVGDMSNKGLEFAINGLVVDKKDLHYNIALNFAHNKNVITKLSDDAFQTESIKNGGVNLRGSGNLTTHIIEEGQEVGTFYNWRSLGLDETGKYVIQDINGDGEINNSDYTYIGHAIPKFTYGILNSVSYRKFDFSVFFRGVYGNDVLNNTSLQYGNSKWLPGSNVLKDALTNGISEDPKLSSYDIQRGSFLRLDNVSLAYNFNLKNVTGLKKCRIYVSGQNLLLLTKFKGGDPEVTMSGLAPGVLEDSFVPRARTLSFGVNISL